MLFLIIQLGTHRYAIDAAQVVEVLPLVKIRTLPHAPSGLAGVFDYHGHPVPLIDLTELALGTSSRPWISTRIILVNYSFHPGNSKPLGLLAEKVTETLRLDDSDFADPSVTVTGALYLGAITTHRGSILQRIEIERLLSGKVRELLSGERIEVA